MRARFFLVVLAVVVSLCAAAQSTEQASAPLALYKQLRNVALSGETIGIDEYTLNRDAGVLRFRNGSFYLLAPVNGKVTGAVFVGQGTLVVKPPLASEAALLKQVTNGTEFVEQFNTAVLRFTDRTYEELKTAGKAGKGAVDATAAAVLKEAHEASRKKLHWNLTARILSDLLRERPGLGLFVAFVNGNNYSGKILYTIDPTGAPRVAPEEISLSSYDGSREGIWTAFHFASEYATETANGKQRNAPLHIETQKLDTRLERGGIIHGNSTSTFVANVAGMRMAPFELASALRVSKVTGSEGQPLDFIQEADPEFWVVLPKALAAGDRATVVTVYEGDNILREDGGVYTLPERSNWYPRSRAADYAGYEMSFTVPKQLDVAATGEKVSESQQGEVRVSTWKSEAPQPSVAFLYGAIERDEVKSGKMPYVLQSYTNKEQPKWASQVDVTEVPSRRGTNPRTAKEMDIPRAVFSTVQLGRDALAESEAAVKLLDTYFGGVPYKHLAIAQQAACNPGQALPQVVSLPMCAYMEAGQRSSAGFYKEGRGYWMAVAAHEVAHQWWGQALGVGSYRDQWISEGFPVFSAGLFLQVAARDSKGFVKYWDDWRDVLLDKNKEGRRPFDFGALTVASRLAGGRAGSEASQKLLSAKGGYILHMIRMMMYDEKEGDQKFKAMMRDFVASYQNRPATTEDFKAVLEKHMTANMNLAGNGKMDWFFNEYVYGTALPSYGFEYSFQKRDNNTVLLKMKATQSNVDDDFGMQVPLYLELNKGKVVRVGTLRMIGNSTIEHEVPLPLSEVPKRATLNYYNDVLAAR